MNRKWFLNRFNFEFQKGRGGKPLPNKIHMLQDCWQAERLVAILPKLTVQEGNSDGIRAIPLIDPTVHRTYYLVERRDRFRKQNTAVFEAFLGFELMAFEKMAGETTNQ